MTIAENVAQSGDGIFNAGGDINLQNTLLASHANDNCSGTFSSQGYNLDDDGSCNLMEATDISTVDPLLNPLDSSSEATYFYSLQESSPALDKGNNATCVANDQIFTKRPFDGDHDDTAVCDIGAIELISVLNYKTYLPILLK